MEDEGVMCNRCGSHSSDLYRISSCLRCHRKTRAARTVIGNYDKLPGHSWVCFNSGDAGLSVRSVVSEVDGWVNI
jgi:hypothetical protein